MIGLNKVLAPVKALQTASTGARVGIEVAKGAAIGATVFDPQEERLSNFIESYPELHNPVTDFLAANLTDTDAEGRFKAALEGIGMDLAIAGVFAGAVKVFKLVKGKAPKKPSRPPRRSLRRPSARLPRRRADPGRSPASRPQRHRRPRDQGRGCWDEVPIRDETEPRSAPALPSSPPRDPSRSPSRAGPRSHPSPPRSRQKRSFALDIEREDMAALIEGWRKDAEAIATWGSREAAEENGYVRPGGPTPVAEATRDEVSRPSPTASPRPSRPNRRDEGRGRALRRPRQLHGRPTGMALR